MIEIDGSLYEGSGQMFRLSLVLSSSSGFNVKIINIRKNRKNSGLGNQHIECLNWIQKYSFPNISEYTLGTQEVVITFCDNDLVLNNNDIVSKNASAITLYTQVILPLLDVDMGGVNIQGSTDTANSIPMFFMTKVFIPFLKDVFGIHILVDVINHGYFSTRGFGNVFLKLISEDEDKLISLSDKKLVMMKQNIPKKIIIYAFQSHEDPEKGWEPIQEMTNEAKKLLKNLDITGRVNDIVEENKIPIEIVQEHRKINLKYFKKIPKAEFGMTIVYQADSTYLTGSAISNKWGSWDPITLAKEAVDILCDGVSSGACIDEYLADQIPIFLVKYNIPAQISVPKKRSSKHLESVVYTINKFINKSSKSCFTLEDLDDKTILKFN